MEPEHQLSADMEGVQAQPPFENEQRDAPPSDDDVAPATEMDVDNDATPTPPSPLQAPAPFSLALHDNAIKCLCPPGTTRLAQDIIYMGKSKDGPSWMHLPCKPYTASLPAGTAEQIKSIVTGSSVDGTVFTPEALVTKALGHAPNKIQRLFIDNFTSKFHCDGPCEGPALRSDYFLCKKCCAWQHKPCMLYGDENDRGGPVCNRCYMSFVLHRDEIVDWQRKRLLMAVKEGWDYLNDPENRHQEWRRAWIRRWLARFFDHNQGVFHKYLEAKKHASRIAAYQHYMSRVRIAGQSEPSQARSGNAKKEDEKDSLAESTRRKQPERKKAPRKALLEGDDEPMEDEEDEEDDAADSDEIVVASKSQSTKSKGKAKVDSRPARSTGKEPGGKREASGSVSPSPLFKKTKPGTAGRAPRKSAPMFGNSSLWDDNDEHNEEDLGNMTILQQKARRRSAAAPPAQISCRCPGKSPTLRECFKCRDCGVYQHYACADDIEDGLSVMCNFCNSRSPAPSPPRKVTFRPPPAPMVQPPKMQPPKPQPIRAPPPPAQPAPVAAPQQIAQRAQQYDPALCDEVNHLCNTVLWREYCSIPMPDEEEAPINTNPGPPPQDWLAECQDRLLKFLTAAGQEKMSTHLGPVLAAFPRQNHLIVKALRDMALEEAMRGSYRGKRKQLGVVLEVLGLDEKGSVWKGSMG